MSRGVKIALIIVGVLFALVATCAGGGYYWWSQHGEDFLNSAKEAGQAGAAFGAEQTDGEACISEGLRQSGECGQMQISCVTSVQMFTQACLGAAPTDPSMCEGVPAPDEVMDSVSWTTQQCKDRGQAGNQFCSNVHSALQAHCHHGAHR